MGLTASQHSIRDAFMRERPIIFSSPMIRALLAGRKTVTRRLVKEDPGNRGKPVGPHILYWRRGEEDPRRWCGCDGLGSLGWLLCPYGEPGDRLWVRETVGLLRPEHYTDPGRPRDLLSDRYGTPRRNGCAYRAECDADGERCRKELGYHWTPAIHMPRWASRLDLEVTGVRVERLHEITEEEARAEGVEPDPEPCDHHRRSCAEVGCMGPGYRSAFAALWMEINGRDSWVANPWVWVVEFRRVGQLERRAP